MQKIAENNLIVIFNKEVSTFNFDDSFFINKLGLLIACYAVLISDTSIELTIKVM